VLLSGGAIAQVMAKLCGVDLSFPAFKPGAVAQTAAARINVIVIHSGSVDAPAFHILWDRASKDYFEGALMDALEEFGGNGLHSR
jgi:sarcosine oxidase subunit gamma